MAGIRKYFRRTSGAIVHRARSHGTHGVKALGIGAVVGAAAQIAQNVAVKNSTFVAGKWWGPPAVLGVGSYLLAKRYPAWAMAMAGAAGFALKQNYDQTGGGSAPIPTSQLDDSAGPEEVVTF